MMQKETVDWSGRILRLEVGGANFAAFPQGNKFPIGSKLASWEKFNNLLPGMLVFYAQGTLKKYEPFLSAVWNVTDHLSQNNVQISCHLLRGSEFFGMLLHIREIILTLFAYIWMETIFHIGLADVFL